MQYDSLGRMVLNVEPDTTAGFNPSPGTDPDSMKAWRYAYDDAGDLVGTSDARGCGANYLYDAAGRLLAEDYSPCEDSQPAYSAPDLSARTGVEVLYAYDQTPSAILGSDTPAGFTGLAPNYYLGRLVAVFDRASTTVNAFDARGRVTRSAVRVVAKGAQYYDIPARYTDHWYQRQFAFDAADRQIGATTGATVPELQGVPASAGNITDNTSLVTTQYTRRGTLEQAGGSYQRASGSPNVGQIQRTADGLVQEVHYGDLADTTTHYTYDNRRRLRSVQTYRGPPGTWSGGIGGGTTYEPVADPNGAPPPSSSCSRTPTTPTTPSITPSRSTTGESPTNGPPAQSPSRRRSSTTTSTAPRASTTSTPPATTPGPTPSTPKTQGVDDDTRRAQPSPHVKFDKRVLYQSYQYDWLGNTTQTDDDAGGFYDRSLGTVDNGTANAGPYQLKHAENSQNQARQDRSGALDARYDDAGNLTRLQVTRHGPCTGSSCNQLFAYDWDEVGRLVKARRWDGTTGSIDDALPTGAAAAHLEYTYDAGDDRVVKEAVDDLSGLSRYTLYLFETLELRRASWLSDSSDYDDSAATEVAYLVRARRHARPPLVRAAARACPTNGAGNLHVFYELGDHLGSTSVVLDQATGELVERTTFEGYGATESDYRPGRWKSYREDRRFTGKEEDVEVGLYYFGKRYLNPLLGRWVSADPLAVHGLGADLNVYAYVHGGVLQNVDPLGLEDSMAQPGENPGNVPDPGQSSSPPTRADPAPAPGPAEGSEGAGGGGPGPKLTPTKAPPQENLHVDAHPEMYGGTEGAGGETHGGPPNANKSETPSGTGLAIGIASVVDRAALELEDISLAADATTDAIAGRTLTKDVLLGTSETEGASAGAAERLQLSEPHIGEGTGWKPPGRGGGMLPERAGPTGHITPGEVIGRSPGEIRRSGSGTRAGTEGAGPCPGTRGLCRSADRRAEDTVPPERYQVRPARPCERHRW